MRTYTLLALGLALSAGSEAQDLVSLGSAAFFGALGATTVVNTGLTYVIGNVGVYPGSAIVGFNPQGLGGYSGTKESSSPSATEAQSDAHLAYSYITSLAPDDVLSGRNLGGLTLTPGVYDFATTATLTGNLTLDTGGDPSAQFVFRMGTTLTTSALSQIIVQDGGSAPNVFWRVGSSATIATKTTFVGSIIAYTAITIGHQVISAGSFIALGAAVTLDDNSITAQAYC